jgi:hypothetical protein
VTPEATRYLEKARLILEHARLMLTVNLTEDAGRPLLRFKPPPTSWTALPA